MKIKFLVADEIRMEASGKQTVLGLFADDVVCVNIGQRPESVPVDVPAGIERLALMVNIAELAVGKHQFFGQLFAPNDAPYGDKFNLGEADISQGQSHTLVAEWKPFLLRGSGFYTFAVWVDDTEHRLQFEVRITEVP